MDISKNQTQFFAFWPRDLPWLALMASKMTESKIYENEIEILLDNRHYTRTMVLYMSFDKFLLAVETCDLFSIQTYPAITIL